MNAGDGLVVAFGRLFALQAGEQLMAEHFFQRAHTIRPLRMAGAGVVIEITRMREYNVVMRERDHDFADSARGSYP